MIGNGSYEIAPLANPKNDARLMAQALRKVGFHVALAEDVDVVEMKRSIDDFGSALEVGGTGLFYYAGHAVQAEGQNFLVPVGTLIRSEAEIDVDTVKLSRVLARMDAAKTRINIIILDACRNNPFRSRFRSVSRGLAFVDAPQGTLIFFATAPGAVAEDGNGINSVFTASLARRLQAPGELDDVVKFVRRDVVSASHGAQIPWSASSFWGDFSFVANP